MPIKPVPMIGLEEASRRELVAAGPESSAFGVMSLSLARLRTRLEMTRAGGRGSLDSGSPSGSGLASEGARPRAGLEVRR